MDPNSTNTSYVVQEFVKVLDSPHAEVRPGAHVGAGRHSSARLPQDDVLQVGVACPSGMQSIIVIIIVIVISNKL